MKVEYSGERFLPEECNGEIAIEHFQRYQVAKSFAEGKVILDAACGEGYGSSILAEVAETVVGLDVAADTIDLANSKYAKHNLAYTIGDVTSLPFPDHVFDMVVSFETVEHIGIADQQLFMKEICRVLKPDGILIMSTPNKRVYTDLVQGENKFHIKEFYVKEYIEFINEYFEHYELVFQYPSTGYFVENGRDIHFVKEKILPQQSRYIIAICSKQEILYEFNGDRFTQFDDSMYYFLYRRVHELEKTLLSTKQEADDFERRQEGEIKKQKEYIMHLEKDLNEQKEYIMHLEKDLNEQKEYIIHLEKDLKEQKNHITYLEKN